MLCVCVCSGIQFETGVPTLFESGGLISDSIGCWKGVIDMIGH